MGCNQSAEAKEAYRNNQDLQRRLEQDHANEASKIKLLLLGLSLVCCSGIPKNGLDFSVVGNIWAYKDFLWAYRDI